MAIIKFSIYRFDPEHDDAPYMQNYDLNIGDVKDMKLLKAIEMIKADLDETLSFRRSCREGVCGSDGMNINGKNGLACQTSLSELKQPIVLRPLPGLEVERDLIVDMKKFYKQYEKAKPFLINNDEPPAKEYLQTPADREKLDGLYECILCACCSTSCPSFWWNPDKFLGPAALLQAWRFLIDSRDTATIERLAELDDAFSVYRCRSVMSCVDACPKGLNPTKAISNIRAKLIDEES